MRRDVKTRSALSGVLSSVGLGTISIVANIVLLPLVISTVGAEAYGVWLFVVALMSFAAYLDLGTGTALLHHLARLRGHSDLQDRGSLVKAAMLVAVGAFLIAAVVVAPLALVFAAGSSDSASVPLIAVVGLTSMMVKPFLAILQAVGWYVAERRLQLAGVAFRFVGTVSVCLLSPSLAAIALVEATAMILPGLLAIPIALRALPAANLGGDRTGRWAKALISYGSRSISVSLLGVSLLQGGTLVIGIIGTPASITYWNAAFRVYSAVRQANGWIVAPFLPVLTRLFARNRSEAMDVVESVTVASVLGTALVCGTAIPITPWLVGLWLGDDVPADLIALTLSILLAGLVLNAVHGPLSMVAEAAGRPGAFFAPQLAWLVAFIAASIPLYYALGIVGVAVALSAPLVFVEAWYVLASTRILGMSLRGWWRDCFRPSCVVLTPSCVLAVVAFALCASTPVAGAAAAVTYAVTSVALIFLARRHLPLMKLAAALRAHM